MNQDGQQFSGQPPFTPQDTPQQPVYGPPPDPSTMPNIGAAPGQIVTDATPQAPFRQDGVQPQVQFGGTVNPQSPMVGQPTGMGAMQPPAVPAPMQQQAVGAPMFHMPQPPQQGLAPMPQQLPPQQPVGMQPGALASQPFPPQGFQRPPIPQQQVPYNAAQPFRPQKRRGKLLFPIAALAALIVLAAGGAAYMRFAGGPIKYAASDATTHSTSSYEVAVPKQWSDQSSNTTFLNKVLGSDSTSDVKDLKTYVYNYDSNAQDAAALIMAGYMETGASDDQMRQALASQSDRSSFESEMATAVDSIGSSGNGCESVTNKNTKTEYDANGYIVRFVVSADCKIATSSTAGLKGDTAHMQVMLGAKNGKFYVFMLLTLSDDWQRNQAFYTDHIIPSLKPKA